MTTIMEPRNKARFFLVLLALVFIVPICLSYWLYYNRSYVPQTLSNGHLILPPLDISKLPLQYTDGKKVTLKDFDGDWVMLYIEPIKCQTECIDTLYKMRQIRTRLGKNMERIQRAVLTIKGQNDQALDEYLQSPYQGTLHLQTNKQALQKFLKNLPSSQQALQSGYLYLVDPLGNVMMSYQPSQKPKAIYKDLTKLLKASQIG